MLTKDSFLGAMKASDGTYDTPENNIKRLNPERHKT